MSTLNRFNDRNRDMQDGFERHLWGEVEDVDGAGRIIRVRGTDTEDQEAVVMNTGYGFNVPKDYNTEVFLSSGGSDTTQKYASLSLPRDKQRKWKEGTGGVQNPTNGDKALEFNGKRAHSTDPNFAVGNGVFEVIGDTVYVRGNMVVAGNLAVGGSLDVAGQINGPLPTGSGSAVVPPFSE